MQEDEKMEKKVCCKMWLSGLFMTALLLFGLPVGSVGRLQVVQAEDYNNLEPVASGDANATKEDKVQWAVYDTDGDDTVDTLVFSGQGAMGGSGWKKYKENMHLIIEDGITTIARSAFKSMNLVGDLTLPESVTIIESSAFDGCSKLDGTLTIKGELQELESYAFNGCSKLKGQVVLPKNAKVIPASVYMNCASLTGSLVIPNSVTKIDSFAFDGCKGLQGTLTLSANIETIESYAFLGCSGLTGDLVLPEGLKTINSSAFSGCSSLNGKLVLPSTLTQINGMVFSDCSNMVGPLVLPETLVSIGASVFSGCSKLTGDLKLPEGLTTIGKGAFNDCSMLTGDLVIPQNVKTINESAFEGCSGLKSINLGQVKVIGQSAFEGCKGLSGTLVLPDSLTGIGPYAFRQCSGLTGKLVIPAGIKEIGKYTFRNTGFTSVIFPQNLKTIGTYAFGNSALQSDIIIPEGVTEIGSWAFSDCSSMQDKVIIIPYSVTTLGDYVYSHSQAVVYNLSGAVETRNSLKYTQGTVNTLTKKYGTQTTTRKLLPKGVHDELTLYHKFPIAGYDDTENIVWYQDEVYTKRITETVEVTANTTFYGKDKLEQKDFAIKEVSGLIYGGAAFTLETTGGTGEGAVTLSVPKDNGVLEIDGETVTDKGIGTVTAVIVGAGEVTVTATKKGNADYKPVSATLKVTVSPKKITEDMVGEIEEQRYTGKNVVPEVEVKDGNTKLIRSADYEISYSNNIDICDKEAPNPPTAIIKGIGNYTGEVTRTFTIMRPQAEVTIAEGKDKITKTYGDSPFMLEGITKTGDGAFIFVVKEGEDVISVSEDGKVTILKAGEAVIGITTKETIAYSPAKEKTISITVDKAPYAPLIPMSEMYADNTCKTIGDVKLPGKWQWSEEDKDTPLEIDKPVSVIAFYNGDDKGNYKVEAINVSVTRVDCVHEPGDMVINVDKCERDKKATCTQIGYGHKECKRCGNVVEIYIEVKALGHTGGVADCIHKAVCERCGEEYGKLDSTRHNRASERKNVKAASCAVDGYTGDLYCKDCGEKVENGTVIKAEGHKWDAGQVTKAATAVQEGVMTYTCSVCKETRTEAIPVSGKLPKKGDTLTDPVTKAKYKITGVTIKGDVVTGTVQYIKPTAKNVKSVSVKASITLNGITYKVTSIAAKAFKGQKKLSKVTIGSNITSIGADAFSGCKKLKTVKMGSKVTTIGNKAFYKCVKLTKITIPAKVTKIGKQAFYGCKALKSITIKTKKLTTKKVGKNAFKGISAKATVKVPKSKQKAYKTLLKKRGIGSKAKIK